MYEFTREGQQYTAWDGQTVAAKIITSAEQDGVVEIKHTVTEAEYRGKGLAGRLTEYALHDIRQRGLKVIPVCPYTASYFEKHPAVQDLDAR